MIDINTVKFEFQASNQLFAENINQRWEAFYQPVFEQVADEVLSYYNHSNDTVIIETLPLDLGVLDEENFDKQFPIRLREALHAWFKQEVTRIPLSQSRFDVLCFFLLHGYLPSTAGSESVDISFLLRDVLHSMADKFREFLESYAHYDFLYKRLVFQFTDEELEAIVEKSHPSESKFVNLYARLQIQSYRKEETAAITFTDYRNAVWILVLTYLFTETGGRFNRKQLVIHTLRGLSARFNLTYAELANLVSERIKELEQQVAQLPELWLILKEIRKDIHAELMMTDINYISYTIKEIMYSIRFGKKEDTTHLLSPDNLARILSNPDTCRSLLVQLHEKEIYRIVEIIIPAESSFIITYAQLLDKHNEESAFRGKAGSEFRILKWEFIFQVLYYAPLSVFSRQQFVLSVIQKLASHYNLTVEDVISFLFFDKELHAAFSTLNILPVLEELKRQFIGNPPDADKVDVKEVSLTDLIAILETPLTARKFLLQQSKEGIHHIVHRIIPAHSEFIIAYSQLLDSRVNKGVMEGKSGSDFEVLKWEFIFSYILSVHKVFFERKYFVFSVLKQLAAHYNQHIADLLEYFSQEFSLPGTSYLYTELQTIISELQVETLLPFTPSVTIRMSNKSVERWILNLFGKQSVIAHTINENIEKWLIYLLDYHKDTFRTLWKEGQLDATYILTLVNSKISLQYLWVRRIGDIRILEIWMQWEKRYSQLKREHPQLFFVQSVARYISTWLIQLTARDYSGWSQQEIEQFLWKRIKQALPVGVQAILADDYSENKTSIKQMLKVMEDNLSDKSIKQDSDLIQVENAGFLLAGPFLRIMFKRLGYLDDSLQFKGDEQKIRAIFLIQYIVYGKEKEYSELQLILNKLFVNWPNKSPLPHSLSLAEEEIILAEEMISGVRQNWRKVYNSSNQAIRDSFFQRNGIIRKDKEQDGWEVKVEDKPYDMLLDDIPWVFHIQKHPWCDYKLFVKWRQK